MKFEDNPYHYPEWAKKTQPIQQEVANITFLDVPSYRLTKICEVILPMRFLPQSSKRNHWALQHKTVKDQRWAVKAHLMQFEDKVSTPCHIVLTRIAPRFFDYDNLVTDFKAIRDEVATYIMQDYVPGRADGSKELTWEYIQEKNVRGDPQRYKIKIGIFKKDIIK